MQLIHERVSLKIDFRAVRTHETHPKALNFIPRKILSDFNFLPIKSFWKNRKGQKSGRNSTKFVKLIYRRSVSEKSELPHLWVLKRLSYILFYN